MTWLDKLESWRGKKFTEAELVGTICATDAQRRAIDHVIDANRIVLRLLASEAS